MALNGKEQTGASGVLTPRRDVVLQVIRESDDHLTAGEIFVEARKRMPAISYATVYNSLKYLKDSGLVREMQFGNGASRYDRETERHDHALCINCGRLVDFELPLSEEMVQLAARCSNFKPESIQLTLRGLCPECCPVDVG